MSGDLVFVDTNVLIYEWDAHEPAKQARAMEWMRHLWDTRTGRVSHQVLAEFYVTTTQKLKPGMPKASARRNVRTLLAWKPVQIDERVIDAAWGAQDDHGLSWWDSLIVASAKQARCDRLLTEDLQAGQDLGGLVIVNPFRTAPGA
jgi:predicted nucleic acid-binding protein